MMGKAADTTLLSLFLQAIIYKLKSFFHRVISDNDRVSNLILYRKLLNDHRSLGIDTMILQPSLDQDVSRT